MADHQASLVSDPTGQSTMARYDIFLPPQETTYIFLLNNHRIKDDRMENSINGSRYRHNLR